MKWKFETYISPTGRAEVQQIINHLGPVVLQHFLVRVRYLSNAPILDWSNPDAKKLSGVKNVYEIRFKADGVQYRPLGFFGPEPGCFTILIWCHKKQNIYAPPTAIDSAEKRRKQIENGEAGYSALQIDGEDYPPAEE